MMRILEFVGNTLFSIFKTKRQLLFQTLGLRQHLRVEIHEIKTISNVSVSHMFIQRLIGTLRLEYLDQLLFCNESGLERKLDAFKEYFNDSRIHQSLNRQTPEEAAGKDPLLSAEPKNFVWQSHCRGLFQELLSNVVPEPLLTRRPSPWLLVRAHQ